VLLGMSIDPDTALAAWAKESRYPGVFVSDSTRGISLSSTPRDASRIAQSRST
jgi:hypothetical protein